MQQKPAKKIAQEPLEILKTAREQIIGPENPPESQAPEIKSEQTQQTEDQQKQLDRLKAGRRMEALNRELTDIRKQDIFKDLQEKITNGEEIPLEDYPELSLEQKQVLKAQMKAVKIQMKNAKSENGKSLIEPATKKGRQLFNFGKKTALKREQTHVEKPVPPSG